MVTFLMKTGRSKPRPGYLRLNGAKNGRRPEYSHIRNLQGTAINECSFRWNFISGSAHTTFLKCQPSPRRIRHYPHHPISIIKESKLAEITGQEVLQVNTFHHQAIRKLAPGFKNHGLGARQYSGSYRSLSHTTNDRCTISSGNIYSSRRYHHA